MAMAAINEKTFENKILPNTKFIKLIGNINGNEDYSTSKRPYGKNWTYFSNEQEITLWLKQGGWAGAVIPEGLIVIDADNSLQGQYIKNILDGENIKYIGIKTPNGWQFIFSAKESTTKQIKQITKNFTSIGVIIDTRTAGKGYIVFPTWNTKGRYIVSQSEGQLDEVPFFLFPIRDRNRTKNKETGEYYDFEIPIDEKGSRNNTLYNWAVHLKVWGRTDEEIRKSMQLIYEYGLLDKTDFPPRELKSLTESAINWQPDQNDYQLNTGNEFSPNAIIPMLYTIENNTLYKTIIKKVEGFEVEQKVMVSRMAPSIIKELSNVERNSVHYEIVWIDRGRKKHEIVPASTLSTKKELITLADLGFPVNDLNYKDLIKYFDQYLAYNRLDQSHMVERLGHIQNDFIHPLASEGCEIVPNDFGERQLLEAFEVKGTVEQWKSEVFDRIKDHPKVLFLVLASVTSVILHDLKVSSFIIDLSGSTSQGKTTALQVARSVWGSESLINEWNATRVSIERKAGFLNSFPLYMDDTRKANERILQSIIYSFSGGRGKGRGSLKGSQREMTWENILISTGEVSLSEYAAKAGGAAARIIQLIDEPFGNVDYKYFSELYEAMYNNFGAIGLQFIQKWQYKKDSLIPEFNKFKDHYMKKSKENEVLTRLSMYYAAVHFAGSVFKKFFNLDFDLDSLNQLFEQSAQENQAIDKPKQLLEEILQDLDADRDAIGGEYKATRDLKAIYKDGIIHLLPSYLKTALGPEMKMVRNEWRKRDITFSFENKGKTIDYKQLKHDAKNYLVVPIAAEIVEELGFDFTGS